VFSVVNPGAIHKIIVCPVTVQENLVLSNVKRSAGFVQYMYICHIFAWHAAGGKDTAGTHSKYPL
jgi:hypothetical protein